jgi:transcriptional regulator with XRE-family HTH domain
MGKPRRSSARQLLATNLRQERTRLDWSQEQLAAEAGISQTYVSQMESAQRRVSIDILDRLALALGIELADLLRR